MCQVPGHERAWHMRGMEKGQDDYSIVNKQEKAWQMQGLVNHGKIFLFT